MTREAIFERISELIKVQMHREDLEITPETSLQDDLGADSIELMEFVISVEDEFGIEITDQAIDHMKNMGDMLDYVVQRVN
ncbi:MULTISPECIES: acyl carrier protein [Streptococcus]|uniref:Acyl carrier protein n=2 Tax=Streptococcus TaxID=1301 RepID=A0ABS2PTU6_9STRE|nr:MULTISPECIES: acyl carrier protein [Streptococcus]MBM7635713.1 acyl carrier protein [Streptococcus saliviloxodontae]MBM7643346.1 acyl carrier protein [Streptococcus loxodontisalivarius]